MATLTGEQSGASTVPAAGGPGKIDASAAPDASAQKPTAPATPPATGPADGTTVTQVPLEVVQALRTELQGLKSKNDMLTSQVSIYQANMHAAPPPGAAGPNTPPATAGAEDPMKAIESLGDSDVITVADLKKIVTGIRAGNQGPAMSPQVEERLAKMEVHMTDPGYEQTIRTYLPSMVNQNPGLIQLIQAQNNPLMAALTYARLNPQYIAAKAAGAGATPPAGAPPATPPTGAPAANTPFKIDPALNIVDQIDKMIENASKPGAVDTVGGAGALSTADRFASMSNDEFDAHVNRVMSGQS